MNQGNVCRFGLLIVLVLVCWPVVMVAAQDGAYPGYVDVYVNDYAGVIDSSDSVEIEAIFYILEDMTGVEAAVLTVNSYREYSVMNESIEVFATGVFNAWGIGDAERNDGVLLVIAIEEREVRIEVGAGYGDTLDGRMQSVIVENILPAFRSGDYSRGIVNGVRRIFHVLTGTQLAEVIVTSVTMTPASTSVNIYTNDVTASPGTVATAAAPATRVISTAPPSVVSTTVAGDDDGTNVSPYVVFGGGVGVLGAGGLAVRRYMRYHQRKCPSCNAMMQRLDEVADDVHLSSGEKAEELLASIDYDVWLCPRCGRRDIRGYPSILARYRHCPKCKYRTLQVSSHTTVSPTTTRTGREVIEQHCRHCKFDDRQEVVLPMLPASDDDDDDFSFGSGSGSSRRSSRRSSSRSSFGGGKSKGGGASGSW